MHITHNAPTTEFSKWKYKRQKSINPHIFLFIDKIDGD